MWVWQKETERTNIYLTVTRTNRLDVPRESEDQQQAPDRVPMAPREEACSTRMFRQSIQAAEAQVRSSTCR